jgi:hypothetical protein
MLVTYETKLHLFETVEGAELVLGVGPKAASLAMKTNDFSVVHKDGSTTVTLNRMLSKEELRSLAWAATSAADEIEKRQEYLTGVSNVTIGNDGANSFLQIPVKEQS